MVCAVRWWAGIVRDDAMTQWRSRSSHRLESWPRPTFEPRKGRQQIAPRPNNPKKLPTVAMKLRSV